jgi:hypothetical protein
MPKKLLLGISLASLALGWLSEPTAPAAAAAVGGGRSSTKSAAFDSHRPCPTCVQAIGLEGFSAAVGGDITSVIVDTFCVSETILVPVIASITTLANGHELLDCRGQAGQKHRIQGAPDLHTWADLGTNILAAPNGTFQFEDQHGRSCASVL